MYKIMIIDDDSTSLAIGKVMLEAEYEVVTARSGIQAMGYMMSNSNPDLILMDIMMPDTSGIELLKSFKRQELYRDIPVILTSGEMGHYELEGYRAGAADVIQKPFIHEELLIKVQRQLEESRIRRENCLLKERLEQILRQVTTLCNLDNLSEQA